MSERKTDFAVVLSWFNVEQPNLGDGISRPRPDQRTKPFRLKVRRPNEQPMTVTLQAPNKREALRYAQNRWPSATVEAV